ncbi:hypothetical protein ELE36_15790 [Pseudolysobacter antarcticus]|uniref:Uncharacterized protein n=1 Tax=Pseudolysobacter antarcticus TaxID=2511995 RepID=A0A411HQE4_9GAMM|nr:hypothetical protein ELE36_15790 [Pseudolysobacter antarcticus]
MGDAIERALVDNSPGAIVVRRDLGRAPIEHIRDQTITGYYTPDGGMTDALRDATKLSNAIIDEVRVEDVLLITTPMSILLA